MRRFAALAGTVAATALAGAEPSATAAAGLAMRAHVSGTVVATWHGDPARGCAGAGVCQTRGSATYRPAFDGRLTLGRGSVGFAGADAAEPPVVRVRDGAPTAPIACADVLDSGFSPLGLDAAGDELQVSLGELELSAGRCAGPRTLDLAHALPRARVRTPRLRRRGRTVDLSARNRFVAGPFSGELISTVRIALGPSRAAREDISPGILIGPPRPSAGKRRYWLLDLQYRIADVSGAIVTAFRGIPEPGCAALGACGAVGASTYALSGVGGRVDVLAGSRLRQGRRRPSLRDALRQVRRGGLAVYGESRLSRARATVTESISSAVASCTDSLFAEPPTVDARGSSAGLTLLLRSDGLASLGDSVRTRCPGPTEADVLGSGALAHGTIPRAVLGDPVLRWTAGSLRAFSRNGYAGSRSGRIEVDLQLVGRSVRVVRG